MALPTSGRAGIMSWARPAVGQWEESSTDMKTAVSTAGICLALAMAGQGEAIGQGGAIHIVALGTTVKLPAGWKLVEDAGPKGCAFETPEGVRVDVVVWTPSPPAQGSYDERHAAWEHGILLKRSCDFASEREQQVPAPFGSKGLLVSGRARTGGQEWVGAYLAFLLDGSRACVIGSFAPQAVGTEAAVEAIFALVEALHAAQQGSAPMIAARPAEKPTSSSVTAAASPGVTPTPQARPAPPTLAAASARGEWFSPVSSPPLRPAAPTARFASLAPTSPWVSETATTGARLAAGHGEHTRGPERLVVDWPERPSRVELAASLPTIAAAATRRAESTGAPRIRSGSIVAALPERATPAGGRGRLAVTLAAALAESHPLLAALPTNAAARPYAGQPALGRPRLGRAAEGEHPVRPSLASAPVRVAAQPSGERAVGIAVRQTAVLGGVTSLPVLPTSAILAAQRLTAPARLASGSLRPGRGSRTEPLERLVLSPVERKSAWRAVSPTAAETPATVALKAGATAAPVARRPMETPGRTLTSTVALSAAPVATATPPVISPRRTKAAAVSPRQTMGFRLAAVSSPVVRAAAVGASVAASPTRPEAGALPAGTRVASSKTEMRGEPLVATPASSGPTVGWTCDEKGLLRVKVPAGWKVSVKLTVGPGQPAIAVQGVHAQDPTLRFAWVQPSLPRYRDLSQLLVAMGYREWQAYKDAASGEVLTVAKRRGARRLLEDVVLPGSDGGLHTWQILDAQPSAVAGGLAGGTDGVVAHVIGMGEHGSVEGWYSVAAGTLPGQSAQTWVGAWLAAVGPQGDRRALEALVQAVTGVSTEQTQVGEELQSMVTAAQLAVRDLSRSAALGQR